MFVVGSDILGSNSTAQDIPKLQYPKRGEKCQWRLAVPRFWILVGQNPDKVSLWLTGRISVVTAPFLSKKEACVGSLLHRYHLL